MKRPRVKCRAQRACPECGGRMYYTKRFRATCDLDGVVCKSCGHTTWFDLNSTPEQKRKNEDAEEY